MADHNNPQLHADRGLVDPTTKYPQPPFEKQSQEWPGLASRMTPKPDHGEQSYVGSGRLLGRKALITGADSGIGRAAAIAYAREGADIAISEPAAGPRRGAELCRCGRQPGLPPTFGNEACCLGKGIPCLARPVVS